MVERLVGRIGVLVGVPERAAIGVEHHRAVIAPASGARLRGGSGEQGLLGLAERIDRVGR